MRIMHIISSPAAGGAEIYVRNLALEMRVRGHDLFLLFLEHAADSGRSGEFESLYLSEIAAAGVQYDFIGHGSRRNPLVGFRAVNAVMRRFRPDIVHAHLYYAAIFAVFASVPVVYTRHGIGLRVPKLVYRLLLDRIVDAYVGICSACARVLESATRKPVVRIDNGARIERLDGTLQADAGEQCSGLTLLAVGRLNSYKNYPLLLEALATLLPLPGWRMLIAGEGEEGPALKALSQRLGLGERVEFLGNVADIPALLATADAFVMSSRSEGLPISLLEATLAGLPVVVTNVGGCAEVVHEACNGIVVDELSVPAFARSLHRVIDDSELRESFARNAGKYAGRYGLRHAVDGHLELYGSLVGAGG